MIIFIFLILFYTTNAGAQAVHPQQINTELQRARTFENQNDLASALRIYQNLYAQYPARGDIVMRLETIYMRTGQPDKAVAILRDHLKRAPHDIVTQLKLGQALFALGEHENAFKAWAKLLENANSPNTYMMVAQQYLSHSLYDRAMAVYTQARQSLNQPDLFAKELAELAERQTRYADAVREYLIFVRQKPQYRTLVEARLRDMAYNGDQHNRIFDILTQEVQNTPEDPNNLSLLIEFALPAGFSAQALQLIQNTPNLSPNSWTYLSRIARYALDENNFDTAKKAFQTLYDRVERPDVRVRALIGLAQTQQRAQHTQLARQYYQAVIDQYPRRPETDEARFALGIYQRDTDNELQRAQQTFQDIVENNRKNEWRYRAFFELAEGHLQSEDFSNAESTWAQILSERKIGPEAAQARFCLAELHYYKGDFDTAKALLNLILVKDLQQDVANDAISKLALIEEGLQKNAEQLHKFAQAELARRQKKSDAAFTALTTLLDQYPKTFLADRILYQQAELLEAQKQYTQAIQQYRKLVLTQKESPLCPVSQMALANIYETYLGQFHEAKSAYETLLIDYPLSFEADLARERLRTIQQKIQAIESQKETG